MRHTHQQTNRVGLSCLALFLALMFTVSGRGENPPFKTYTTTEGLAHDSVNKIVRDSRGFLWFCTGEGLSRFDGNKFKNYTQDQGLPSRNINDLLETRDGTYLIATSVGLTVFNPNGKAYRWNVLESKLEYDAVANASEPPLFQTFAPPTDDRLTKTVLSLAQDRQGVIWVGTRHGLFQAVKAGAEWQFREFARGEFNTQSLEFGALVADSSGGLLIGLGSGCYRISPGGDLQRLSQDGTASILEDREGRVWIGAGGNVGGIHVLSKENGQWTLSAAYTAKDGLPADSFVYALIQTPEGRILASTYKGLCEFVPDAKKDEPKFRLLTKESVLTLAEDSGGSMWLGTEVKGARKFVRNGFTSFGESDGLPGLEDLVSVHSSHEGGLFVSSRPNGFLHLVNSKFERILPAGFPVRSWGWHFLEFQARDGEWWIPCSTGLLRYPKVERFSDLAHTPAKHTYTTADGLTGNEIFNLFEDSIGDIWITSVGPGENSLQRWERKTERIIQYTTADGLPAHNGAISFAENTQGTIWFGFYFGGLMRYRNGKFQSFTAKDGIPDGMIYDLMFDSNGRLWVATSGHGLFRVDNPEESTPVFNSISTLNGLSSNQTICLTEDRFKRIYVGTGRGINRLDANGSIKLFTQEDGLPSNYVTRCAAEKDGTLWFIARNALVRFVPEFERVPTPPPVFIDRILVNGVAQRISEVGETQIPLLELGSDQHQIQIDFYALTFGAEENISYQYRLDNQNWSNPTRQQSLNLDLASGTHSFLVRAVRSDGIATAQPAGVSFRVRAPLWLRWWFMTLAILLLLAILYGIYRYRVARLREVNAALANATRAEEALGRAREERLIELERVRTRIATDLHDDIGASLTQIAILSQVAQQSIKGNGVNLEPLESISNVSNELVDTMSDIVWAINPRKDHLQDLIQRMRRFASDILSAKGIGLEFDTPGFAPEIPLGANARREVFLIFKESLTNIVKHSAATQVRVQFEVSADYLTLKITDNGKGFDPGKVSSALFADQKGGHGIFSMKKRAAEMRGSFDIESAEAQGTLITFQLPLSEPPAVAGG